LPPFEVDVLPVNGSHAESMELAETLYRTLTDKGVDAAMDDRNERPGLSSRTVTL
jgi:prolyl-tRNA synthetase